MSVAVTRSTSAGLFVPFRNANRGGGDGSEPVGTLSIDAEAAGDGSAGSVTIAIAMARLEFGMHPLFVPTYVNSEDSLVTAEEVEFQLDSVGNERIQDSLRQVVLAVDGLNRNVARFVNDGLIVEPSQSVEANVFVFAWKTNTNALTYHGHVFGYVYDAELLARAGGNFGLLAGLT